MKALKIRAYTPILGLLTAVFFQPSIALSQEQNGAEEAGKPNQNDDWDLQLGAVAFVSPDYEGSDDYEPMAFPYVHVGWKERVFLTTRGGPGLYVQQELWDDFSLKGGVRYEFGRNEDDNDALEGLGDLDVGAVAVGALAYELGPVEFSAELSSDLTGDRDGTKVTLGAEYSTMVLENRGRIALGPNVTWANDDYMDNTFGISTTQASASRSNYSTYEAESGIKDAGFNASFSYGLTEHVSILASGNYTRLLGDAADSPIVDDEGSANQFTGTVGLIYRW